ncbi:MAG TPA: hypothetical protein VFT62_05705 [Mycobacteriales bacterium]|nr:hypothetical protein [Mycobacteriales bacterium]
MTPFAVAAGADGSSGTALLSAARDSAPVVLTGAQIPQWSAPPAEGIGQPWPSGTTPESGEPDLPGVGVRTAHNGTLVVPPTPPGVTPVDPDRVAAYAWSAGGWKQIPVQVDQRFPYFLANGRSDFGIYSGTDEELTYAWAPDAHDTGEEAWKKMFGACTSTFATAVDEVNAAIKAGWLSLGPQETAADYLKSMTDPQPLFDADDELSFMARDAAAAAPGGTAPPAGASDLQTVTVTDPLDPANPRYVYLAVQDGGSSYHADNGYVSMTRDADSETWLDKDSFAKGADDGIGTSNTGYGPNLPGTVCQTAADNPDGVTAPADGQRPSKDREPRDDFTISTPTYRLHATGRWLVQGLQVAKPIQHSKHHVSYGPNVLARWKGRAFQQSPDSSISLVGFEDEQVNWEMNSTLLGWRQGPVRAIREIWGADSGTNVTKTEYYYRDADVYAYHVRVHPIPPDGLYTDWSYRPGIATTYYNVVQQAGVPIDGQPDTSVGEVDQVPVTGQEAEINTCDPHFTLCSALDNPEEVAGPGFGLVYEFELTGPTAAAGNAAVVPYYRDDACFDDGTGDAPAPRPWPGEASTDERVQKGYLAYWQSYYDTHPDIAARFPTGRPTSYSDLKCQPQLAVHGDPTKNPTVPPWQIMPFSGAIAEHGIHFFATQDSDNAFGPKNVDEIDGQQWRFEVPMATPTNVLVPYGANVSAKLVPVVTPYAG